MQADPLAVAPRGLPEHIGEIELEARAGGQIHHDPRAHLGLHLAHLKGHGVVVLKTRIRRSVVKARRGTLVVRDAVADGHHDGLAVEPVTDVTARRADEFLHRDLHLLQVSDGRRRQIAVPLHRQRHHHEVLGTLGAVRLTWPELVFRELDQVAS